MESNRNSTGLNVVSGTIRLFLNNYDDTDGRNRMESGLRDILENFKIKEQQEILTQLIQLGTYLGDDRKEDLCISIVKYFPNELEKIADIYGLIYLLDDSISKKVKQLKKNIRLIEMQL